MIGKAVMDGTDPSASLPRVKIRPATVRKDCLADAYRRADVLLLPSRFEGVPLTVLEALAFGNVIVATGVGAVGEIVRDKENGFLLDPTLADEEMTTAAVQIIRDVAERPECYQEVRLAACRSAMETSWTRSADRLARTIESNLQHRK
jgi:glycosyltransferase involved in cell wall biosynthesis